jgi:hypothetical protein
MVGDGQAHGLAGADGTAVGPRVVQPDRVHPNVCIARRCTRSTPRRGGERAFRARPAEARPGVAEGSDAHDLAAVDAVEIAAAVDGDSLERVEARHRDRRQVTLEAK